ncbi:hypothetical protein SBA3_4390002 [Candidatus Sulfopaludibacter sp. SbA3]|nr:hypothetical protein SBA3_4390002 [Candidatus Sulfopaludibacter sp. SbA3]
MRFMMMVKANKDSEAGVMPSEEMIVKMGKYNEELMKAGVLVDLAGLKPSSNGFRATREASRGSSTAPSPRPRSSLADTGSST